MQVRINADHILYRLFYDPNYSKWLLWDFLAQCILVRGIKPLFTYLSFRFYSPKSSKKKKDLSLLDRVGSKHPCRNHSFILGNCILRSFISILILLITWSQLRIYYYRLLATWMAPISAIKYVHRQFSITIQGSSFIITSFIASMAVNALVTELIVFKDPQSVLGS